MHFLTGAAQILSFGRGPTITAACSNFCDEETEAGNSGKDLCRPTIEPKHLM